MSGIQQTAKEEFLHVMRHAKTATLSILDFESGGPLGTLVNFAIGSNGRPIFLFSGLSRHTKCLLADPRASVLVMAPLPTDGDALTAFRATIVGAMVQVDDSRIREQYLQQHPNAAMYAGFGDFSFWCLHPEHVFIVAGFGRVADFPAAELFDLN